MTNLIVVKRQPLISKYLKIMKKILSTLVMAFSLLAFFNIHAQSAENLFISEYAEGSSSNKYIEIFNGTGSDVDLANYEVWKISNGGDWPESTLYLSGTLTNGVAPESICFALTPRTLVYSYFVRNGTVLCNSSIIILS